MIVGSFVATLVIRWPREGSALRGRSACDACGETLKARDIVPLLSALALHGRCRMCGARIDRTHAAIEGLCALVGLCAMLVAPGLPGLLGALSGWLLVALAALDLGHFWLPNQLTAVLALLGLCAGFLGIQPHIVERLMGGLLGFGGLAMIAALYRHFRGREGMGGGDPKLLGAIGLMLGWQALPSVLLGASAVGLAWVGVRVLAGHSISPTDRLPLGALMALAAFPLWLLQQ